MKTIDDKIEEWHNGAGADMELHEYLGMSWKEYQQFIGRLVWTKEEIEESTKESQRVWEELKWD